MMRACGGHRPTIGRCRSVSVATASLTATAVAAFLAGCTSAGSTSSAASTGSASAPQGSASSSTTGAASAPARNLRELARRMSAATKVKSTARVEFDTGSVATMSGSIRYHGAGADMSVTTDAAGQHVKLVLVNGVGYVATGQKIQGKSWARISRKGKDPLSRALGPALTTLSGNLDVSRQLAKEPDAKIVSSSASRLGGVPVTRYKVTLSERDLLAQLSAFGLTDALRAQVAAQFRGAHGESVLYVDGDDLLLRAESRVVGGRAPDTTSVVTYSGWGEPVEISAPPASDTVDAAALA
jgi:hypothetical protein